MTCGVVILGSTGSIGTQALDVIGRHRDELPRGRARRRSQHRPARRAGRGRSTSPRPRRRARASHDPAGSPSWPRTPTPTSCSTPWSGFAGLPATISALEHGKRLALANKESLIAGGTGRRRGACRGRRRDRAGRLRALARSGSACGSGRSDRGRTGIVLTASGGPFRGRTPAELGASPSPTRSSTRRGRWAPRSRSTRRRS